MTPPNRGRYLAATVVNEALTDAGADRHRVDALFVGNMTSGLLAGQQQFGGLIQMVEAHLQLTAAAGENQVPAAEVALVQNIGGTGATVVTHVLRRVD